MESIDTEQNGKDLSGQLSFAVELQIRGTTENARDETITFTEVMYGRDRGLWACGKCNVAFHDDWRIKHVNWHFKNRRSGSGR